MICLKLATRTGSFQVDVDATPPDCGVASINYERKPLAVPGTWNTSTNYADSQYQLPRIDSFTPAKPNTVYVGDITYLPIAGGSNMYLATVIDCYSRQLTGFAIADHMRTELVEEALTMARKVRGDLNGAIFHSDHGSVYTSEQYRRLCERFGVTQSMGMIGTSADNSLAESFNASLKREVLKDEPVFPSQLVCRRDVFQWCIRYNTKRLHSWCGYRSPNAFEAAESATLTIAS